MLLPLITVLALAAIGAGAYYKFFQKVHIGQRKEQAPQTKVFQIAEFEIQNSTRENNQTENASAALQKAKPVTLTFEIIDPRKLSLFDVCEKKNVKEIDQSVYVTRIIAGHFKSIHKAKTFAKTLKHRAGFLDPWVLKDKGSYLVIAGSYSSQENIKKTIQFLKEIGIVPKTQRIKIKEKKKYIVECTISENKKEELERLLNNTDEAPGQNSTIKSP
ncbi:hypothetical protein TST_1045 [Thermosulfidibacter takaii ABI70S6]|uniref:SPOR domain-containing protein n=1 Tax=Thermosulfidibacter takaii (strain DSM 17441 / JCM 13301 / NBRC 103674 / ABI70S6) TaxID=1298851 RepID=A0A0S3QU23_THET7|nr:SPOR domain-containing protein [Thermosulfidibacter takaii]BAT71839.1 hypothetical protein TST_1045 [Thermosulfidibacter takaii ABI70S6]